MGAKCDCGKFLINFIKDCELLSAVDISKIFFTASSQWAEVGKL
jgi:hypothetical protein